MQTVWKTGDVASGVVDVGDRNKIQIPYTCEEVDGIIPVIWLNNNSMYTDYVGEDVWSKFFVQPYGKEAEDRYY